MSDLTTDERLAAVQALKAEYRRGLALAIARKQILEKNPYLTDEERTQVMADLQRNIDSLEWMATEAGSRLKKTEAALDGAEIAEEPVKPVQLNRRQRRVK